MPSIVVQELEGGLDSIASTIERNEARRASRPVANRSIAARMCSADRCAS
jgi:hypothetical protein